jgi:hypothetical protein
MKFLAICIFSAILKCYFGNLYSLLGIDSSATPDQIKRAYRKKARDTHPDKQRGQDEEEATKKFRQIADAYEVLSDKKSRADYDRTGKTPSEMKSTSQRQKSQSSWWSRSSSFSSNNQQSRNYHRYYTNPYTRRQILAAQSRVLTISSKEQLESIALDVNGVLDRFLLLAVYDSSNSECEDYMNYQAMYPWPFAGFTRENDNSMWWEEIMLTVKLDINGINHVDGDDEMRVWLRGIGIDIYSISSKGSAQCPTIAFFPKSGVIGNPDLWNRGSTQEFREWVWEKLKMSVTIENKTPWVIQQWWLDGSRGKKLDDIQPDMKYNMETFLSHTFIYRASYVEGNLLNNEVFLKA